MSELFGNAHVDPQMSYFTAKDRQAILLGTNDSNFMGSKNEKNQLGKIFGRAIGILAILFATGCTPIIEQPAETIIDEPDSVPMQPMIDNGLMHLNENPIVPVITQNP